MRRMTAHMLVAICTLVVLAAVLAQPQAAFAQDADCFVLGDDIVVESGQVRECNVLVVKGDVIVLEGGAVNGNIAVAGGDAEIGGSVDGDVWASGDITLNSSASVTGGVIAVGEVEALAGARVDGRIGRVQGISEAVEDTVGEEASAAPLSRGASIALTVGFAVALVMLAALFAALATAVAPDAVANVRGALSAGPTRTFFLGLIALVACPFLMLVLVPVFPLIPVVAFAYLVLLVVGAVGVGEWLGRRLAGRARRPVQAGTGAAVIALVLSLGYAVGSVVDYGWLLSSLVLLVQIGLASLALGAAILTLLGTKAWPRREEPIVGTPVPLPGDALPADEGPDGAVATGVAIAAVTNDDGSDSATAPIGLMGEAAASPDTPTAAMAAVAPVLDAQAADAQEPVDSASAVTHGDPADAAPVGSDAKAGIEAPPETSESEPTPGWGWSEPEDAMGDDVEPSPDAAADHDAVAEPPVDTVEHRAGAAPPDDAPKGGSGPVAEPVAEPPAGARAAATQGAAATVPHSVGLGDVPGISPIYEHLLKAGGVPDLGALANAEPEALAAIVSVPGVTPVGADAAAGWVRHARDLLA